MLSGPPACGHGDGLRLRYPTALDLPGGAPSGRGGSSTLEDSSHGGGNQSQHAAAGVSIDRRGFRRLRRRGSRRGGGDSPRREVSAEAQRGVWLGSQDLLPLGPAADDLMVGGDDDLPWSAVAWSPPEAMISSARPQRAPSRPMPPHYGSPQWAAWTTGLSPARAPHGPERRSDRVARGAQMRAAWGQDRFLRSTHARKFDLRGCGSPTAQALPRRDCGLLIPDYVPPHEKRRDLLRVQVRQHLHTPDLVLASSVK